MLFNFDNENLVYTGRNDITPDGVRMYYAGSQVKFNFKGTSLKALINAQLYWGELSLGVILDGEILKLPLSSENNGKDITVDIAQGLSDTEHNVIIYKKHRGI